MNLPMELFLQKEMEYVTSPATMTPSFHWKNSTFITPHYRQTQWKWPDKVIKGFIFGFWD